MLDYSFMILNTNIILQKNYMQSNHEVLKNWLQEKERIEIKLWEEYRKNPKELIKSFHNDSVFQLLFHEVYDALQFLDRDLFTKEQLKQLDEVMAERKAMGKIKNVSFTIREVSKEEVEETIKTLGKDSAWISNKNKFKKKPES